VNAILRTGLVSDTQQFLNVVPTEQGDIPAPEHLFVKV
jgi:hypothetical protein